MIFRKPTVIQIKAEEDMQDIQPANRNSGQFTPNNPLKGRLQELRNQMDIERNSHNQSQYLQVPRLQPQEQAILNVDQ